MNRLFLCILLTAATASAKVEWKQTKVSLEVYPTQVSTEAVFHFANTGKKPIHFTKVEVTCGCLTAKPTKSSYAPGEEGVVTILWNLRNRKGPQQKHVKVETSDGQYSDLVVTADIPVAYKADPTVLIWKKGDAARQKTIRLSNSNAVPIKLLSITSSNKELPAELKTIRKGFEYEVTVTRGTTKHNARSVIRIATEPPPGLKESKTIKLYVVAM